MLVGRDFETSRLAGVLDAACAGRATGLALRGDPGIGKTALLRWARDQARNRGFTCLDAVGLDSRRDVPYGAVAELLSCLLDDLDELDDSGVLAALVDGTGSATLQRVAATVLRAVAAYAERAPVLVVIDDAQLIDESSATVVATLARRMEVDRLAVVVASRQPLSWWHPTGRPELAVSGLAEPEALELLARAASVPTEAARDCWALTGGNPLALLELGPRWIADTAAGTRAPLPERLATALDDRLVPVQPHRDLLLAVALSRTARVETIRRATSTRGALDACIDADVLTVDGDRVLFVHPLLRARVLEAATIEERRRVHTTLADAVDPVRDADARAWHLAETVADHDDDVAALLADTAAGYRRAGAPAEAAAAYERSARLTTDTELQAHRLVDAADMAWFIGDHARVDCLLDEATSAAGPSVLGRAAVIRGQQRTWTEGPVAGLGFLEAQAAAIADDEPELAAACLGFATYSALVAVRVDRALELSARAVELASSGTDPVVLLGANAARGSALLLAGRADEADALLEPIEQLACAAAESGMSEAEHLVQMVALAHAYCERWDRARALLHGVLDRGRASGALEAVAFATGVLGEIGLRTGRWHEAYGLMRTIVDEEWGEPGVRAWPRAYLARVCAAMGRDDECRAEAAAAMAAAEPIGLTVAETWSRAALALLALGRGRPREALAHLDEIAAVMGVGGVVEPGTLWWEGDHLDALVACGELGRAKERLAVIEEELTLTGRGYAAVVSTRGRAQLADDDLAEALYAEAVAVAEAFTSPFELARTLLARARRRRELGLVGSDDDVQRAAALFDAVGAEPWAAQARGEREAAPAVSALDLLSKAELRVAMAVTRGLTNRQASIDLCISIKTVDYHLQSIYRKLGVRTRTEMTAVLLGGAGPSTGSSVSDA